MCPTLLLSDSGVYKICNSVNGKFYIGSTSQYFRKRFNSHKSMLRRGIHPNAHLQNSWNKHGEENFAFSVIEVVETTEDIVLREQHYIDEFSPSYNISPTAGSTLGCKLTDETKEKLSIIHSGKNNPNYGKKHSDETRLLISLARKGKYVAENHSRAKLTQEKVDYLFDLIEEGYSYQKIADMLDINKSTVYRIKNGRTNWKRGVHNVGRADGATK